MSLPPLTITTPAGSYDILVGTGLLATLPEQLARLGLAGQVWLIADSAVYAGLAEPLLERLRAAGLRAQGFMVAPGEQSKDLAVVAELYTWLIGGGVERRDTVLALGGGVTGDLAGFVAATALRGVALVQLPTTLLAMVDSALGGKTGVNHPLGKNLIGAFHQPRLVLSDIATLDTLPPRQLCSGWAEVIKHGVIWDAGLFEVLEQRAARSQQAESSNDPASNETLSLNVPKTTLGSDSQLLASLIHRAAAVKVAVVNIDERERAERMLLNYGHTLGHAIEAAAGYGTLLHGEAVAIGMELAGQIAVGMGMFRQADLERQRDLLRAYGLSTMLPAGLDPDVLLDLTLRDKKVAAGTIRWVLPSQIGAAHVRGDVPDALVRQVVAGAARA